MSAFFYVNTLHKHIYTANTTLNTNNTIQNNKTTAVVMYAQNKKMQTLFSAPSCLDRKVVLTDRWIAGSASRGSGLLWDLVVRVCFCNTHFCVFYFHCSC